MAPWLATVVATRFNQIVSITGTTNPNVALTGTAATSTLDLSGDARKYVPASSLGRVASSCNLLGVRSVPKHQVRNGVRREVRVSTFGSIAGMLLRWATPH